MPGREPFSLSDLRAIAFSEHVTIDEIHRALGVSLIAAESLHGAAQVRFMATPRVDAGLHVVEIDCSLAVGLCVALVLVGLLSNLHGWSAIAFDRFGGKQW